MDRRRPGDLPKLAALSRERHRANPLAEMLRAARQRAKRLSIPFSLTLSDISLPDRCPILDIPLAVSAGCASDGSPTLDRLQPEKGYVAGNVVTISFKANRAKNNLTLEEVESLAVWMSRHISPRKNPPKRLKRNPA